MGLLEDQAAAMITYPNLDEFEKQFQKRVDQAQQKMEQVYYRLVSDMFDLAVSTSPQWSGNFAANWKIQIGKTAVAAGFKEFFPHVADEADARFMDDPEALAVARAQTPLGSYKSISLKSGVTLFNPTPYGQIVASNRGNFLRPGNYVDPTPISLGNVVYKFPQLLAAAKRGAK